MTKEEIVDKIEQIAHKGATGGINADYIEREAEKLADEIVLFTIPVVSKRKPLPPKPPKDREVHLGGFSRHKRD